MTTLNMLIKRNCKLFFKDKGMFFTSLITPIILLVLYISFLGNVYKDAFSSFVPTGIDIEEALINATVGGQLISSLFAVSCITVAFCSNLLMVQDKVTGARRDLTLSPINPQILALGYFISSTIVTLIITFIALFVCLIYLSFIGWYLSIADIFLLMLDIILLVTFGTALSSVINCNLSTNGQASAVGTIVSSGYGFVCGAYMPISNFGEALQRVVSFLPGTYGTCLLRNHALRGVFAKLTEKNIPKEAIQSLKDSIDYNLYFFDNKVSYTAMYLILIGSAIAVTLLYVAICRFNKKNKQ